MTLRKTDYDKECRKPSKRLYSSILGLSEKIERQFLKVYFFCEIRKLIYDFHCIRIQYEFANENHATMEYCLMDRKIIQLIIREILETEEYTLEGIAYYARVPLDVIIDAVCGKNCNLSITFWGRIIELYVQVKPDISNMIMSKISDSAKKEFT